MEGGLGAYTKLGCNREVDNWGLVMLTPAHGVRPSIPGACNLGQSVLTVHKGTE